MHDRTDQRQRLVFRCAAFLAITWVLVIAPRAEAYIDPSAGGMLVQLLLAGTAGVAILGKLFWMRIKRLFGARDPEDHAAASASDEPNDRV
jgi:hypothetical protein